MGAERAKEKWMVKNKTADFAAICSQFGVSEIVARLLVNRGLTQPEEIQKYLYPKLSDMYNPFQMKDLEKTCAILMEKIKERKKIRIIGDYDVDGVVSTYVLLQALKECGAIIDYQIPDRKKDGYGVNISILEKAKRDGIDTIITCDNGITAVEQTAYAKSQNMTVLITDHHDIPEIIPQADAIVNPKQKDCPYPYKGLCGAGVVYKLVQALYQLYHKNGAEQYLEYIAIATVCDVMDLTDENRCIVSYGLKQLKNTDNFGLRALIEINSIIIERLSTYHLGYIIGPCLNATGRLDTAVRGVELLSARTKEEAVMLATELKELNEIRKDMTAKGVEDALKLAEKEEYQAQKVLILYLLDCHESLAGIIAGRVRERFHKPAIVLTKGEESIKGSGRSIEGYSMFEELNKCREYLLKFGGHPMAAGLSLEESQIEPFRKAINEKCSLTEDDLTIKISIDIILALSGLTEQGIEELDILEPFGKGNDKPVFAERNLHIRRLSFVGKSTRYVKLQVEDRFHRRMDAMYFGDADCFVEDLENKYGEEEMKRLYQGKGEHAVFSVIYYPGINEYNGNRTLQIVIQNYQMA